jgi:hypothetical protein
VVEMVEEKEVEMVVEMVVVEMVVVDMAVNKNPRNLP